MKLIGQISTEYTMKIIIFLIIFEQQGDLKKQNNIYFVFKLIYKKMIQCIKKNFFDEEKQRMQPAE